MGLVASRTVPGRGTETMRNPPPPVVTDPSKSSSSCPSDPSLCVVSPFSRQHWCLFSKGSLGFLLLLRGGGGDIYELSRVSAVTSSAWPQLSVVKIVFHYLITHGVDTRYSARSHFSASAGSRYSAGVGVWQGTALVMRDHD